jgi:hypothetical protein
MYELIRINISNLLTTTTYMTTTWSYINCMLAQSSEEAEGVASRMHADKSKRMYARHDVCCCDPLKSFLIAPAASTDPRNARRVTTPSAPGMRRYHRSSFSLRLVYDRSEGNAKPKMDGGDGGSCSRGRRTFARWICPTVI